MPVLDDAGKQGYQTAVAPRTDEVRAAPRIVAGRNPYIVEYQIVETQ
jgi:hypothetical protein